MVMGGSWSAYWYNGVIVSSEIARGMDIYELVPNGLITENELAAAKTVRMPHWNTQDQQKMRRGRRASSSRARISINSRGRTDWTRQRLRPRGVARRAPRDAPGRSGRPH